MRITAEAKSATRQRIIDAAVELFRTKGFEATTTRDIAEAAEIATGTLFNYFATKDAIVVSLVGEALAAAHEEFAERSEQVTALEEHLFAFVAAELRRLRPFRKYVLPMLETALCPLAMAHGNEAGESIRVSHLEIVTGLVRKHGLGGGVPPLALQLYWTLYTGVLAFWASDKSPKQEETLALLDQSLAMFVAWLGGGADEKR